MITYHDQLISCIESLERLQRLEESVPATPDDLARIDEIYRLIRSLEDDQAADAK